MVESEKMYKSIFDHYFCSLENAKQFEWIPIPKDFVIDDSQILHQGNLSEMKSVSNLTSQNYYILTGDHLIKCVVLFKKNQNQFISCIFLMLPKVNIFQDKENASYGFTLYSQGISRKFLSESKQDILKWYRALSIVGIQSRINKFYIFKDKIFSEKTYKVF